MQGVGGSSPLVFTTSEQAFYRLLRFFVKSKRTHASISPFCKASRSRLACSVVNILMTAHSCCLFFAVYKDWLSYPQSTKNIFHAPAISTREVIAKITSLVIFLYSLIVLGLHLFYDDDIGIYEYFFISVAYFHTVGHCAFQAVHIFFDSLFDFYKITLKFLLFVSACACAHNKDP